MHYEDWEYHPTRLPEDKFDREREIETLQKKFLEEVLQNPKTTAFLKPYRPGSGEYFLKNYAFKKGLLVAHSEYGIKAAENRELRHRDKTECAFKAILQKKLLNLELLWRAEQITLPGIDACIDFTKWYRHPMVCPFIEQVTAEEIELMQQFLAREETDIGRYYPDLGIEDSEGIADKSQKHEDDDPEIPEWFTYYDTYMDTASLFLLPDIRGQKEQVYFDLAFKEQRAKNPEASKYEPNPEDSLPWMDSFSPELHYQFSKLVDDEIFQRLFYYEWQEKANERAAENQAGVYDIDDCVVYLSNVPDPPPVRVGVTWREAIYYCWMDYLKRVISEELPIVWEEHKFFRETGLETPEEEKSEHHVEKVFHKLILRGRELAGEPRDFEF